jgi:hypothetical protein
MTLRYQRPESVTQAHWLAAAEKGREALARGLRSKAQAVRPVQDPQPVQSDADLIAAAVAAGRVTQLPAGHACGTTRWEAALGTSRPVRALSRPDQRQRAQRVAEARVRAQALAGGA